MSTSVTVKRQFVPLSKQEAADRLAVIKAILEKNSDSLLTPAPIPATIVVKLPQRRGEH